MKKKSTDITVFISMRESICSECGHNLGTKAWIVLEKDKRALCLSCADLDHLVFLPSGDAALTRRSKKHSGLSAVVIKWSRSRKRYERQGLLVESEALKQAEEECLSDSELRKRNREREAVRRAELDREYVKMFAARIRELYPSCPIGRERQIAEHACLKYSSRIGRSAQAKKFSREAIRLAVAAHIRHAETDYDEMLMQGFDRYEARLEVKNKVMSTLYEWESPDPGDCNTN